MCEGKTSFCRVFFFCMCGDNVFLVYTEKEKKKRKKFHRAVNDLQCRTPNLLAQCSVYQAVVLQASVPTAA